MKEVSGARIDQLTFPPKHHFFGYYDLCPWDASGNFLLALETDFIDREPEKDDPAGIGLVNLQSREFKTLAETFAWNWQQGCRLQWLPPNHNQHLIYNDRCEGRFISFIFHVPTGEKSLLPLPIYTVAPSGEQALSFNFSRLNQVRKGYGYPGILDPHEDEIAPEKDGIYLLHLKTKKYKMIISLAQLIRFKPMATAESSKHWIDHLMFSPDGSRFCFLHRWQLPDGGMCNRLLTSKLDGTELSCLLESDMVSHFAWKDRETILCWGRLPGRLSRARKNLWLSKNVWRHPLTVWRRLIPPGGFIRGRLLKEGYLLISPGIPGITRIGEGVLDEDGHCSWSPDGRWLATDTYADRDHRRTLILYDYECRRRIDLARFDSLPGGALIRRLDWDRSGLRCDLHPRWNRKGTHLCFDSVHQGSRQIYQIDVSGIISRIRTSS